MSEPINQTHHAELNHQLTRYALISVADKQGLMPLAEALVHHHVCILASDGTYNHLKDHSLFQSSPQAKYLVRISEYTQFNEMLSSRVKTLHHKIHAGILADRDKPEHSADLSTIGAGLIDYVVVNFYPFKQYRDQWLASLNANQLSETAAVPPPAPQLSEAQSTPYHLETNPQFEHQVLSLQEFIDIGGPTMLRAAAKNWNHVITCSNHHDYHLIEQHLQDPTSTNLKTRRLLAAKAFETTADFDRLIAKTLSHTPQARPTINSSLPSHGLKDLHFESHVSLPYGENSHQTAQWHPETPAHYLGDIHQLQGRQLSYNNYLDLNACLKVMLEFAPHHSSVVIKHGNPCGFKRGDGVDPPSTLTILDQALSGDPLSAFGGVVGCSFAIDDQHAEQLVANFYEVVIAPAFSPGSREIFKQKPKLRIIQAAWLRTPPRSPSQPQRSSTSSYQEIHSLLGGLLIQDRDHPEVIDNTTQLIHGARVMSDAVVPPIYCQDATVAFQLVKHLKSNAICLVHDAGLIAQGSGFTSRIEAAQFALSKAKRNHPNKFLQATLASDGFFPFRDVVDEAARHGVRCIISPAGSKRDHESIQAAREHGIHLIFAPNRHFLH